MTSLPHWLGIKSVNLRQVKINKNYKIINIDLFIS